MLPPRKRTEKQKGCRAWITVLCSNFFRHYIRCAIRASEKPIGFVIANDLLLSGVESQRAPQAVRSIGKMHERRRNVSLFNRRMNILGAAAANAIDEVRIVITGGFAVRSGLHLIRYPRFVGVVAVDGQIAV